VAVVGTQFPIAGVFLNYFLMPSPDAGLKALNDKIDALSAKLDYY
jgi:hypothetical protein